MHTNKHTTLPNHTNAANVVKDLYPKQHYQIIKYYTHQDFNAKNAATVSHKNDV